MHLSSRHLAVVALLAGSCALALAGCGGSDPPDTRTVAQARASEPPGTNGAAPVAGLVVDVSGQVAHPGVYELAPGSRVHEAIEAAGGLRRGADVSGLNRAAPLTDGQQVLVPSAGSSGADPAGGAAGQGTAGGSKISINQADAAQLDELPGVGPVTAQRIVDERESGGPFASVDDLDRVSGIGPATIEALREVATT